MSASCDRVSSFLRKHHLFEVVLLLALLGLREVASLAIHCWYEIRREIDEESYSFKIRHVENQHQYDDVTHETKP
jgi:hypothetical protein